MPKAPDPEDDDYYLRYKCQVRSASRLADEDVPESVHIYDHDLCDVLPTGWLFVCKSVHQEAMQILYSENRFRVAWIGNNEFDALEELGRFALSLIRCLEIDMSGLALGNKSRIEGLVARLAPHLCGKKLRLNLIFDTSMYLTTVITAVSAMIEQYRQLGQLANCAIRIGPDLEPRKLNLFVKDLVKELVIRNTSSDSFPRFLELPQEIQRDIIDCATVVGCDKQGPTDGLLLWDYHKKRDDIDNWWNDDYDRVPSTCCGTCAAMFGDGVFSQFDEGTEDILSYFCSWSGVAYSSTCTCTFRPPTNLFTVSRSFGASAKQAFYSQNTFVMSGYTYDSPGNGEYVLVSPNVVYDLEWSLPKGDCSLIRKLHLRFNLLHSLNDVLTFQRITHHFMPQFSETMEDLASCMYLPQLRLTLDFTSATVMLMDPKYTGLPGTRTDASQIAKNTTSALGSLTDDIYELVGRCAVTYLKPPPRDLWYHISWSLHDMNGKLSKERQLEQMVMGEDYEAKGKPVFEPLLAPREHANHSFCMPGGCMGGRQPDPRQYRWSKKYPY